MDEQRRNEIALVLVEEMPKEIFTSSPQAAEVYAQFKSLSPLNELRGVCAYPLWIHAMREMNKAAMPEEVRRMYTTARVLLQCVEPEKRSQLIAEVMQDMPFPEDGLQQLVGEIPALRTLTLSQEEVREFMRDSMIQMMTEDCV